MTSTPAIVFVHGAAVSSSIWDLVRARLSTRRPDVELIAVDRPATGSLRSEVGWLAGQVAGRFVVGVSGGATLGLALAASGTRLAGALLHEPAVGTLLPGLLNPVVEAFDRDGIVGFGSTLYGPSWDPSMAPYDRERLAVELAMFRAFEPAAPAPGQGRITLSVGALSPEVRHTSVQRLESEFGLPWVTVPGASHFVPLQAPDAFAELVVGLIDTAAVKPT